MQSVDRTLPQNVYDTVWPARWRDWQVLLLLLVCTFIVRGWILWATEVPSRDSVGFIRYALKLDQHDWTEVIRPALRHPGYPISILFVSWPVRAIYGATDSWSMQFSAQLASALAGWLLTIPLFLIGKEIFSKSVGFWGTLLFQCLPESGQILSDAVSEPLFLFLLATSLYFGIIAVKQSRVSLFMLCGVFSALSYLVRPEGLVVSAATGLVLVGMQVIPFLRRTWSRFFLCGIGLTVATLVFIAPLVLITGKLTTKPSAQVIQDRLQSKLSEKEPAAANAPLFGSIMAVHFQTDTSMSHRAMLAVVAICAEFSHGYQYFGWLTALIGIWWCRDRFRLHPGSWVVLCVFLIHLLLIWILATVIGYVSVRHVLVLILCSMFQAVGATLQIPYRMKKLFRIPQQTARVGTLSPAYRRLRFWCLTLAVVLVAAGLVKSLRPKMGHRTGHYLAGQWLATHAKPADRIRDDHCWAYYYAGRVFLEGRQLKQKANPREYVVVSRSRTRGWSSQAPRYEEDQIRQQGGRVVYHWPEEDSSENAHVLIYEIRGR